MEREKSREQLHKHAAFTISHYPDLQQHRSDPTFKPLKTWLNKRNILLNVHDYKQQLELNIPEYHLLRDKPSNSS